jgi:predicted glutamine amidotransferase
MKHPPRGLENRFHDPTPAYSDSLRPRSQLTPHAVSMKVAHLRLAFPIEGVESLEESHPSRLPP